MTYVSVSLIVLSHSVSVCNVLCSAKEPGGVAMSSQSNYVRVASDGTCNWWPRFETSASHCPMNIAWFPFDEQSCDLVYESWRYENRELNITAQETPVLLSHYKSNGEWDLVGQSSIDIDTVYQSFFSLFCYFLVNMWS